jgi:hypothetical protein
MDQLKQQKEAAWQAQQQVETPKPIENWIAQTAREMTPREKLLHEVKAAKDVNLRRLVALHGLEDKINRMGEYDCEVVQAFQELTAEATR